MVKDRITYNGTVYNNSSIYGGVSYDLDLNPEEELMVGAVSAASIKFKMKTKPFDVGDRITYQIDNGALVLVGNFNITNIEKGKTDYTFTALDDISKLDQDCTAWKQSLTLPMTLAQVFTSICTYLNISPGNTNFVNNAISFDTNYIDDGVSFRQVMQYIAQCAAGFCYMNRNYMEIKSFNTTSNTSWDNTKYKSLEQADYVCPSIDKIWYGRDDGDVGYTVGSGNNVMKIYTNPFMVEDSTHTAADITTALTNIYNVVSAYSYRPFKMKLFLQDWWMWGAGHNVITINSEDTIPFHISWGPSGIDIEATGSPSRDYVPPVSSAEQRMNGKYNSLKIDIDGVQREIGDVSGAVSSLSQTVEGVRLDLTYAIEDVADDLNDHAVLQSQYIRYGPQGLELGKEGDPIKALLTNSELAFFNGSIKATYLNTDVLNISKVWIVGPKQDNKNAQLFIGEFQFIRKEDGSLALKVGS